MLLAYQNSKKRPTLTGWAFRMFTLHALSWWFVREREFWILLEEVFGRVYGRTLAQDQRLDRLSSMTVVEALAAGIEPRVVWNILCDQMEVPDERRWGKDHNAPPLPAA